MNFNILHLVFLFFLYNMINQSYIFLTNSSNFFPLQTLNRKSLRASLVEQLILGYGPLFVGSTFEIS